MLKVPSQNNDMMSMGDNNMSPMDSDFQSGDEEIPDMNNDMGTDENENLPSEFDSNFDAGVEADEETDPKKYIQQLTGKLSQTLNSYNNENGEPDTELGKYVLGMLVKQGTKGMDDKDRKEIIKKINTNDSEIDDDESFETSDDTQVENDDFSNDSENIQNESKVFKFTKKQIFESFGIAVGDENIKKIKKEPDTKITSDTKKSRKTRPFEAPKKFKN